MKAHSAPSGSVYSYTDRRRFLTQLGLASAFFAVPGAFAEKLMLTPRQTEGPFYPNHLPLDTDNDLLVINEGVTPAVGDVTYVSGRILDSRGDPIRGALVEIWQCDHHGAYLHTGTGNADKRDKNFQGFGRFLTGSNGGYYFRTIKPVPYPSRPAPHIHFMIKMKGCEPWTTQLYIKGHPGNQRDGLYRTIGDEKAQQAVTVDFAPVKSSRIGEVTAKFDIVLGFTPDG